MHKTRKVIIQHFHSPYLWRRSTTPYLWRRSTIPYLWGRSTSIHLSSIPTSLHIGAEHYFLPMGAEHSSASVRLSSASNMFESWWQGTHRSTTSWLWWSFITAGKYRLYKQQSINQSIGQLIKINQDIEQSIN